MPGEFLESISTGNEAIRNLNKKTMRAERAIKIVRLIGETNRIFLAKKNATLIREDHLGVVNELHTPCCNYDNFVVKIASLATLFEVDLNPLKRIVLRPGNKGSIKLVKDFLIQNNLTYEADMLETWKNIKILRNMPPLHAGRRNSKEAHKYLEALGFFGIAYPIDYDQLWERILDRFLESLEEWQSVLQQIP